MGINQPSRGAHNATSPSATERHAHRAAHRARHAHTRHSACGLSVSQWPNARHRRALPHVRNPARSRTRSAAALCLSTATQSSALAAPSIMPTKPPSRSTMGANGGEDRAGELISFRRVEASCIASGLVTRWPGDPPAASASNHASPRAPYVSILRHTAHADAAHATTSAGVDGGNGALRGGRAHSLYG